MGVMAPRSLQRIVFAVFHHLNQNWSQQPLKFTHESRRYLGLPTGLDRWLPIAVRGF
jgi:hypothetical protein